MAAVPRPRESEFAILVAVVAVILVGVLLAIGFGGGSMMGAGSGMAGGWVLGMVAFVAIGVAILGYLFLAPGVAQPGIPPPYPYPTPGPPADRSEAVRILEARFARGEISREDYFRTRQDLEPRHP